MAIICCAHLLYAKTEWKAPNSCGKFLLKLKALVMSKLISERIYFRTRFHIFNGNHMSKFCWFNKITTNCTSNIVIFSFQFLWNNAIGKNILSIVFFSFFPHCTQNELKVEQKFTFYKCIRCLFTFIVFFSMKFALQRLNGEFQNFKRCILMYVNKWVCRKKFPFYFM